MESFLQIINKHCILFINLVKILQGHAQLPDEREPCLSAVEDAAGRGAVWASHPFSGSASPAWIHCTVLLVVKVNAGLLLERGQGTPKWSRQLWRIIYGRWCDAWVVLWLNRQKMKSEAEWFQFPNFTRCTCRLYIGCHGVLPPHPPPSQAASHSFHTAKVSSSLTRPLKVLHDSTLDSHRAEISPVNKTHSITKKCITEACIPQYRILLRIIF